MKVTDEMVAAFVRGYGTGVGGVPRGLAAVLELIENSPVGRECGRRQDGTLLCRPANVCPDCPLVGLDG